MLAEFVISFLNIVGAAFALVGSIGLARLHGPTKATTLGVGSIVVAALVGSSVANGKVSPRELAISLFLFITAPISAHLLGKAALKVRGRSTNPRQKSN
jgi:multicomponent K+:H+ antiporter subunit G